MNKDHFVSIIIPALNEEKVIGRCLEAIRNLSTPEEKYEVILVDNGSIDNTIEIARKFGARIVQSDTNSQKNISAARNLGKEYSRGNILAFIDADCIVSENWLNSVFCHFDQSEACAVGHKYSPPENSTWIGRAWDSLFQEKEKGGEVDWLPAGNFIILKSSFDSVGGFDESLVTNEDCDLCYRLKEKGHTILSEPTVRVVHLGNPQTCYEIFRKELWHGKGAFQVFWKDICLVRNVRPVIFAFFYLLCLTGILVSTGIFLFDQCLLPLFVLFTSVISLVIVPLILSIKTLSSKKCYGQLIGLTTVYFIYGIARAICLLKMLKENIKKNKKGN